LLRLDGFVSLADVSGIGRDLTAFAYVAYMCEVTDQLVVGSQADPGAFAVLYRALDLALAGTPSPVQLRRFELCLLECLGLLPTFGQCCVCGLDLPEPGAVAYDVDRGGILCPAHAGGATRLDPAVLNVCRALLGGEADPLATATAAQRRAVRDLALDVLRRHLRRPLRSLEFFAQLAGVSARSEPDRA
jgi:DNA repair protein RecO (recombination protein O)